MAGNYILKKNMFYRYEYFRIDNKNMHASPINKNVISCISFIYIV